MLLLPYSTPYRRTETATINMIRQKIVVIFYVMMRQMAYASYHLMFPLLKYTKCVALCMVVGTTCYLNVNSVKLRIKPLRFNTVPYDFIECDKIGCYLIVYLHRYFFLDNQDLTSIVIIRNFFKFIFNKHF